MAPMTSMAQTNSSPLRRWVVPPFFTIKATAPRTIASPPAAMWIGKSMGGSLAVSVQAGNRIATKGGFVRTTEGYIF